jgi:ribonuclease HI
MITEQPVGEKIIYKHLMIFSDGGARGNPGPAAIAFMIRSETGETLTTYASTVGVSTNNQAEYKALLAALDTAASLKAEKVTCHLDSELVVKQLSGEYKVKSRELKELWQRIQELKKRFIEVKFVNVPRTHTIIQEVDTLVNVALDGETGLNVR